MANIGTNKILENKWIEFRYKINNLFITQDHIEKAICKFNTEIISKLRSDQEYFIMFKIKIRSGPYRNISNLQRMNKTETNILNKVFIEYWSVRAQEYKQYVISDIIFTYFIIPGGNNTSITNQVDKLRPVPGKNDKNKTIQLENGTLDTLNFAGYTLPATMDITKWGLCDFYNDFTEAIVYKKKSIGVYYVKLFDNYLYAEFKIEGKLIFSFTDHLNDGYNLTSFTRNINNISYIFKDGELNLKSKTYKSKFIETKHCEIYLKDNFITMDLETRIINDIMEVYHISIFDGKKCINFYLSDFKDSDEMLKASINSLLIRKYHGYKVYLHNFSKFDGIFLLKRIASLSQNINIIMKDNNIINLTMKYGENKYYITFRDSFLLLPSSLKKLAKSFEVDDKLIFPYSFVNTKPLDYEGKVPNYKYFDNISYLEYREYKLKYNKKKWNLKNESKIYCEQDVKTLHAIIMKFNKYIFNLFRINAITYPTISSLSFAIFRAIFLKNNNIPILTGELYNFIRKGYTGGALDVFKPFGKHVYRYDVNSLYPYIMKNFDMPIGEPTAMEGGLENFDLNTIAFIETEVQAPNNLEIPFLQTKFKGTKGDIRTVSPLGSWTGVYSSAEIKKALELGYKFKYLRGVSFSKANLFTEFVDYFYELKKNSSRNSSDYVISKFFLNSLSGRFALDPILDKNVIINNEKLIKLSNINNIISHTPLGEDINLVSYKERESERNYTPNVSIAVSAWITSLGRLWMYQFKNKNMLYTDTDSIDTTELLNPKFIGDDLGQFKLEHVFDEAVYLAPKVYGGIEGKGETVKVKGLKNPIPYKDLKTLLYKDAKLILEQEKWVKNLEEGNISIINEIYSLMVTDNKRSLIYENNLLVKTKSLTILPPI